MRWKREREVKSKLKREPVARLRLNEMEREDGSRELVEKIARRALVARLGWMSR
jgi:hypothetical protein